MELNSNIWGKYYSPLLKDDGKTIAYFVSNQIIASFGNPNQIVTDHGTHFQNKMMTELANMLGFKTDH